MLVKLSDEGTDPKGLTVKNVYDALYPVWNRDVERLVVTYKVGPKSILETNGCDVRLLGFSSDGYLTFIKAIEGLTSSRWPVAKIDVKRVRDVRVIPKGGMAVFVVKNGKVCRC